MPTCSWGKSIADLALRDPRRMAASGLSLERTALMARAGSRAECAPAVAAKLRAAPALQVILTPGALLEAAINRPFTAQLADGSTVTVSQDRPQHASYVIHLSRLGLFGKCSSHVSLRAMPKSRRELQCVHRSRYWRSITSRSDGTRQSRCSTPSWNTTTRPQGRCCTRTASYGARSNRRRLRSAILASDMAGDVLALFPVTGYPMRPRLRLSMGRAATRSASRVDAYAALSEYMRATVGLGVDELLLRVCLDGRLSGRLAEFAKVDAARVRSLVAADGPELWSYDGKLTVQGVVFRFECVICYDPAREVYAIEVLELAPIEWTTRMVVA